MDDEAFWRRYDAGIPFANATASCAVGRRVCVTDAGRLGCVPPLSQVGDGVVLIHEAPTPFVVGGLTVGAASGWGTDGKGTGTSYELAGACYMHGIMVNEALGPTAPKTRSISFSYKMGTTAHTLKCNAANQM